MCVRVFLAEDSEPVRKAIRILLSGCKDIKVVGEATTFSGAIQKSAELQPDEIIFDLVNRGGEQRLSLAHLRAAHEGFFPSLMGSELPPEI